jgi:phospholipase C
MSQDSFSPSRRKMLAGMAGSATAAATLAACGNSHSPADLLMTPATGGNSSNGGVSAAPQIPAGKTLPKPEDSGIDHIVVVMMENRSFDHMLGWVPGADGVQAGLSFKTPAGQNVSTFALSKDSAYGFNGCGHDDPDHSYDGGRKHLNGGAMDGWLQTVNYASYPNDKLPVGYFTGDDLQFYKGMADNWTIGDRYFSGILSSTYPNRFYMHSGQTDRLSNTSTTSTLPTIWDRMADKKLTANYFCSDIPLLALWGTKYVTNGVTSNIAAFLAMAAAGQLPSLSYIDPRFLGEGQQGSNDDHPAADVRDGQAFLNSVYSALTSSPQWSKTLLIVTYDEWGGFFDHVVPPVGPVSADEAKLGNDGRLGFRVPLLMAGPRVPKNSVCKLQFDPQSILNLITWRFGLDKIGSRADWSLNLAYALDFTSAPRTDTPSFTVDTTPHNIPCTGNTTLDGITHSANARPTPLQYVQSPEYLAQVLNGPNPSDSHFAEWLVLKEKARTHGFAVSGGEITLA